MKQLNVLLGAAMALALAIPAANAANQVPGGAHTVGNQPLDTVPVALWGLDGTTPCLIGGGDVNCQSPPPGAPAWGPSGFTPVTLSLTSGSPTSSVITGLVAGRPINLNFEAGSGSASNCQFLANQDGTNYMPVGIAGTAFPNINYSGAAFTDSSAAIYKNGAGGEVSCASVTGGPVVVVVTQ